VEGQSSRDGEGPAGTPPQRERQEELQPGAGDRGRHQAVGLAEDLDPGGQGGLADGAAQEATGETRPQSRRQVMGEHVTAEEARVELVETREEIDQAHLGLDESLRGEGHRARGRDAAPAVQSAAKREALAAGRERKQQQDEQEEPGVVAELEAVGEEEPALHRQQHPAGRPGQETHGEQGDEGQLSQVEGAVGRLGNGGDEARVGTKLA
jgi:hypothetical protein